eukprot:CAMPEP_0174716904 /NCGR_PEP_ID=MMETSP1094-20130205/25169_1 /TAXON_ID=156173 /ORGANISM="Chrysochromulina brevifilum, Strain UTEX LB 985" /LENGTH=117 /DNA_ID=CAMNT_0015916763 /DNA_START=109 /DNA_END=462 /DNA_ORIENTATION=-
MRCDRLRLPLSTCAPVAVAIGTAPARLLSRSQPPSIIGGWMGGCHPLSHEFLKLSSSGAIGKLTWSWTKLNRLERPVSRWPHLATVSCRPELRAYSGTKSGGHKGLRCPPLAFGRAS